MTIPKSPTLTAEEARIVDRFSAAIVPEDTYLIWDVATDDLGRRYIQLRSTWNRFRCYLELIPAELERLDDEQVRRMIVGEEHLATLRLATLDDVMAELDNRRQRATYGAVGGFVGEQPIRFMEGRPLDHHNSWVVAATTDDRKGSRFGWPTGYADDQIHPDCLNQIRTDPDGFIGGMTELRQWLEALEP